MKMLELGFYPEYLDRVAIMQGLRKRIQQYENLDICIKLCKSLSEANLI